MDAYTSRRLSLVIDWIAQNEGLAFKESFVERCDVIETFGQLSDEDQQLVVKAEIALGIRTIDPLDDEEED